MPTLQFLGASGGVTGSKYLLSSDRARILIDCGMFQGRRESEALNWQPLPVDPASVQAVVLTHAHIDHTGYLPRWIRLGYAGPVYCTHGTADLCAIMLPDAGYLQEEEAHHANRHGWSRHHPAEPLFTLLDAQRSLRQLRAIAYGQTVEVAPGMRATFHPAGHIIGSASVTIEVEEARGRTVIVFSGDVGRPGSVLLADAERPTAADYLLIESTYGDRLHPPGHVAARLAEVVRSALARGGMLLFPAFAVGRAQELLYLLRRLEDAGQIPSLDTFLDSPMAIDASEITRAHREDLNAEAAAIATADATALAPRKLHIVRDAEHSKAINRLLGPGVIVSASGMCTGGRIRHHLHQRLPDARHTVCIVGYQALGTPGRALLEGARELTIFGERVPVRATIAHIEGLSAHADRSQLLDWLEKLEAPPRQVFIVHGEPEAACALEDAIAGRYGFATCVPTLGQTVTLAAGSATDVHEPLVGRVT
ncbi:MAG TPA: MBL fold metallo-hydrolase [Oscillatoriaceae cyanobacterium]